ncbi:serine protease [Limnoraphis robusta]|uniref:Serine protease n=2 Tax=Limnoraphis TaxID=1332112 RepID=A0ABU5TRM2_9CYAN|nr:serine protease [Limnoraphis robusta]MEA5497549.1 serine protease [Limnoraphis robusta BA-68 BA1]MEA5517332.1 serine protease [Limnoraphis robusta CCNP1315]
MSLHLKVLGTSTILLLSAVFGCKQIASIALAVPTPANHQLDSINLNNKLLALSYSHTSSIGISAEEIARQVTVRILTNPGAGSGVIIGRRGNIYTVLTNNHVVIDSRDNRYTILTSDGLTHSAQWLDSIQFPDADLALMEFRSDRSYRVVELGNSSTLETGDTVYAAGFPNWDMSDWRNGIYDTRDWGTRAFRSTVGQVEMILPLPLTRGYGLGYTNEIEQGMSGGPVLDGNGRLVGVNGRLKYPLQGMSAYTFENGTQPSASQFQQMEALSWAVPISRFRNSQSALSQTQIIQSLKLSERED